jgi:phage terminase Nu1 subunit (DNA packaging protein)
MTRPARKNTAAAAGPKARNPTAWRHVNRLQLAELVGVHPDTISDYSRAGMSTITRGGLGKESVYDAVECLAWWRNTQGQDKKAIAQTRAYEAAAKLNEQRLLERRHELVSRETVLLTGQHYTKSWAAKIRSLPRRLIEAGLITHELESPVAALCREVLTEIASWKTLADLKRSTKRKAAA